MLPFLFGLVKKEKKMHSRKLAKGEPKTEWDSEFFWEFEIFSKAFQKQWRFCEGNVEKFEMIQTYGIGLGFCKLCKGNCQL